MVELDEKVGRRGAPVPDLLAQPVRPTPGARRTGEYWCSLAWPKRTMAGTWDTALTCLSDLAMLNARPNAELTGRRRMDGLAVRPMINQGGRTAKLASRWRSG